MHSSLLQLLIAQFYCLISLHDLSSTFQVSTIVQVVGISLCLHAATRISHRAQGIASIASKWHALMTCGFTGAASLRGSDSVGSTEHMNAFRTIHIDYSESDLESLENVGMPTSTQLATYMSTYHKRQALGMELIVLNINLAHRFALGFLHIK